ncbi:MAG: glycosyltransferase family 4 protein [Patescibacteria group bacterium]|jgi:glycogen(starch) synthase|nr:glycosyltransferase family 4 protein [Patescibacteria group bacterium]
MGKKVLMFGWELPPQNSGGLGVACFGLSKSLAERGVEVTFVLPRKNEKNPFFNVVSVKKVYNYKEFEINSLLSPYLSSSSYKRVLSSVEGGDIYGRTLIDEVCRYAKYAKDIALSETFDVIHAHDWLSFEAGITAKKVSGKPLIVHIHATEFDRGGVGRVNQEVYNREKEGMEKADRVIAVSNFTKGIIMEHYGIPSEKIEVVHNGMDDTESKSFEKEELLKTFKDAGYKTVAFIGRITVQKGPDYFLKMAKKVLDYNKKVIFIVAGSGDMERQIMRQTGELEISDKVFFTGFLRGKKLYNLFREADIFVMPSISEPFGLTPLESLINGTPVLISKQSGVSEVLKNALKVDFWDTDEMANKILTTLSSEPMRVCLARNGELEAKRIKWDSAADKCISIYNSF